MVADGDTERLPLWLKWGQHPLDFAPQCGAALPGGHPALGQQHSREQRAPRAQGERGGVMVNTAKYTAQLSPSVGLRAVPEQGRWDWHRSEMLSAMDMLGFYDRKCQFI